MMTDRPRGKAVPAVGMARGGFKRSRIRRPRRTMCQIKSAAERGQCHQSGAEQGGDGFSRGASEPRAARRGSDAAGSAAVGRSRSVRQLRRVLASQSWGSDVEAESSLSSNLRSSSARSINAVMDLGEVVDEVKNHLDARQVNSQVALIGHDRPEPADLRGLVAFFGPFMGDVHESQRLIAREHLGRDRQFSGGKFPRDDPSSHGRRAPVLMSPQPGTRVLRVTLGEFFNQSPAGRVDMLGHDDLEHDEQVTGGLARGRGDSLTLEPKLEARWSFPAGL